jgi:hypothetical protein
MYACARVRKAPLITTIIDVIKVADMSNGDRMSLPEGAHVAGMALLLAFAAAFILSSARAAKPADTQELSGIVTALTAPAVAGALPWKDLEARLRGRWADAGPGARPPGLETAPAARTLQMADAARRRPDNWQIVAWGTAQTPNVLSLRREGQGGDGTELEAALRSLGVPFVIECETDAVRHYRLAGRNAFAAQYGAPGAAPEILFFWTAPPEALLRRDGCLITSARR